MEAIICVGVSGSGKTSYAKDLVTFGPSFLRVNRDGKTSYAKDLVTFGPSFLRVNRDDLRLALCGTLHRYYERTDVHHIEGLVNHLAYVIKSQCHDKYNVVLDNTNLKLKYLNGEIEDLQELGYDIKIKLFDCDYATARSRIIDRDFQGSSLEESLLLTEYIVKQSAQYEEIKKLIMRDDNLKNMLV